MKIEIECNGNQVNLASSEPIRVDDLMTIMFTLQLEMLRKSTPPQSDENYTSVRDFLYDQFNSGASKVLEIYAPDKELRPDLTLEAMKYCEDEYMKAVIRTSDQKEENNEDTKEGV